ncbi:MAG: hypothetical protein Q8P26_04605 [Candidatus Levybacteria bacterium]|nr:hypothetical protein [Candidatus Levybacteria bacterium]
MKKIKKFKTRTLLSLVSCCLLLVTASPAAAAPISLSIDPAITTINAISPSKTTSSLTIKNNSDKQVAAQITIKPFKAFLENGELEYLDAQDSFLSSNVRILDNGIPVETLTLAPDQSKNLTLSVNVPRDTKIRDYYFSILFISQNPLIPTSTMSLNQLGVASNVLLSIGPKQIPDASLEEFSSDFFFKNGPIPFTIRIKNKGKHFMKPKGEITIRNMFGQTIGRLDLTSVNILSNSIRAIPNNSYVEELKSEDFLKSKSALEHKSPKALWEEKFLLGFYTATLNIMMSDEGPLFTKSINFFALPIQGIVGIIILITVVIVIKNKLKTHLKK